MEKLTDRIKKLLALASNNPSENEAEAALLMAQRLMAENSISMSQVDLASEKQQEKVVNQPLDRGAARLAVWERALATVISKNFRCYSYTQKTQRDGKTIASRLLFIGTESDVEIATTTYLAAWQAAQKLADRYMNRCKNEGHRGHGRRLKTDYLLGWVTGLSNKYEAQRKANQQWAIVLARPQAVEEAVSQIKTKNEKHRVRTPGEEAFAAGWQDGRQFGSAVEPVDAKPALKE